MNFDRLFNIAGAIVTLAGITVFVTSPRTSHTINAVTRGFAGLIQAATGQRTTAFG